MVIWLIGISGAGKTTLGNKLKEYFDSLNKDAFVIDGNFVREFFDDDLGFSKEDRIANIKRIILAAHILSQNNIITIVCNISPFEPLREFMRKKVRDYNEIYLKRDLEICQKDDVKKIYQNNIGKTEIVGMDLKFDQPKNSDLIIDTGKESAEESFKKIINYLKNKYPKQLK